MCGKYNGEAYALPVCLVNLLFALISKCIRDLTLPRLGVVLTVGASILTSLLI